MTTSLGPLPQFLQKTPASFKSNPLQFDDELDSLLNDDVQPGISVGGKSSAFPTGHKPKSDTGKLMSALRKTSSLKSSKPKSKLMPEAAKEFDNSPDVSVTEEDKAKIVESIKDIDDMESNLFHSLNKTQPKKSLGKVKKTKSSETLQQKQPRVAKKVSFEDEELDEQEQELMREINKGLAASKPIEKTNSPPPSSKPQEDVTAAKDTTKSNLRRPLSNDDVDDDDDDLFADLLSDSEGEDQKHKHKQTKPKLKLIDNISKAQPTNNDSIDNVDSKNSSRTENSKELKQQNGPTQRGVVTPRKQTAAQEARDNDDDDEFSGDDILGLIDTPQKPTATKKASRFDELLGRKQLQEDKQQPKKEEQFSLNIDHLANNTEDNIVGTLTVAKEDESSKNLSSDFQFGGYLPSTISSNVSSRKSRSLPQGRRKGLSDTITSERPSTAPGKKSVRFSDAVDSGSDALRPSSTPVVKGHLKQEEIKQHHSNNKGHVANLKDIQTEPKTSTTIPTAVKEKPMTSQSSEFSLQTNSAFGVTNDTLERPPTGSRRRRDVALPLDQQSLGLFESTESATLLPSQECSAPSKPHPSAMPTVHQDALKSEVLVKNNEALSTTSASMTMHSAVSHDTVLQQQLAQQQLLIQQQSFQLQQLSSELATSKMQLEQARSEGERNSAQVKDKLLQELDLVKNQLKEVQEKLEVEKAASSKLKMEINELENKVRVCEDERTMAVKQCEATQQQNRQLSDEHRKEMASITLTSDDLKMKLHRTELERDQLQQTLQLCQQRHTEEIESIEKSHSTRNTTIEEAHQRREQRWREEQEMEAARHAERVQQLEQEKLDSAIAQRKKLEALEISKTNEMEKLQAIHRSSVDDLYREHELEIQHLKTLHEQEMAALKAAFSHTRALTDLTRQVEASSREVSTLQQKVDKAHSLGLTQREETLKCREEQLKANERRLAEQQAENEAERVRLQTLISRMESSLSDQTRQLEQERWKLQQDSVRLNAQQAAFDQDRASFTSRMEQERADLQAAKDKFLAEQREIMSKCYKERRAVADEQSKLSSTQKVSKEKELRETERLVKTEKTLKLQVEKLQQESSRLAEERTKLLEEQEMQESHHKALQEHEKTITDREKEADRKLQQAIEMHEMATKMYKQGEQSLQEAQVLKETAESQLASVRSQQAALQKREKHLTQERLNFVKERKEQIQDTYNSSSMQVTATIDSIHDSVNSDDIILPSLDHTTLPAALPTTRSHMGNLLDQLDTSIQLRRIAMEAEQDDEYLEEEKNFLSSLRNSGRLTLMELESS